MREVQEGHAERRDNSMIDQGEKGKIFSAYGMERLQALEITVSAQYKRDAVSWVVRALLPSSCRPDDLKRAFRTGTMASRLLSKALAERKGEFVKLAEDEFDRFDVGDLKERLSGMRAVYEAVRVYNDRLDYPRSELKDELKGLAESRAVLDEEFRQKFPALLLAVKSRLPNPWGFKIGRNHYGFCLDGSLLKNGLAVDAPVQSAGDWHEKVKREDKLPNSEKLLVND